MFNVTHISYAPGDTLIFGADMNAYTYEECVNIFESFKKQVPDAKVIFVPDDLIKEILVLNKQFLAYDTTPLTITSSTEYPPAYLTNSYCSDNEGEVKSW